MMWTRSTPPRAARMPCSNLDASGPGSVRLVLLQKLGRLIDRQLPQQVGLRPVFWRGANADSGEAW